MGLAQEQHQQQQQHDLSTAPWTSQWPGLLTGILLTSMTAGLMQHQPFQQHLRMRVTQMSALIQMPVPYMQPAVDERWTQRLVLQDRQLREGTVLRGNQARTRRFTQKLIDGEPVSVGWVGGSIATGVGSSDRSDTAFGPQFFRWINETFPHPDHRWKNGGVDGTTSSYMALCLSQHVDRDVDIVLVEYALNDFQDAGWSLGNWDNHSRRAIERLLRKLLQFPKRPAVIMLGSFPHLIRDIGSPWAHVQQFYMTAEDEQGVLAQYYSLPWVSFRDATWRSVRKNESGYSMADIMAPGNDHHPNDRGHLILADLAVSVLQSAGRELAERPLTVEDEAIVHEDLQAPMLKHNEVFLDVEYCLMREKFHDIVTRTDGFKWVNEAKKGREPKLGFVGTEVGARLEFRINSNATFSTGKTVPLRLSYLASYEKMGKARVECIKGCSCHRSELDGIWEHKQSQLQGHAFSVSRHPECTVRVTIMEQSSSDGHKVKVAGVAVSDEAGSEGGFLDQIDFQPLP